MNNVTASNELDITEEAGVQLLMHIVGRIVGHSFLPPTIGTFELPFHGSAITEETRKQC